MEEKLRYTFYKLETECENGDVIVMNTLWRSIVRLDPAHRSLIGDILSGKKKTASLPETEQEKIRILRNLEILVTVDEDTEKSLAASQLRKWQNGGNSPENEEISRQAFHITYTPTFACNFKCSYCVQKGNYTARPTISAETNNRLAGFIDRYVAEHRSSRIICNLFGGEPTLAYDRVLDFVKRIDGISRSHKLPTADLQMVSNGFLLHKNILTELKSYGLNLVQITLDGLRETHNKRRPHFAGIDTFDKILENLCAVTSLEMNCNLLNVLDLENTGEIFALIDLISNVSDANPDYKLKRFLTFCIFSVIPSRHTKRRNERLFYGKEIEIESKVAEARKYAMSKGFRVNDPFTVELCFRELTHSFLFDPEGLVYKCYSILGDKDYAIARIEDGIKAVSEKAKKWYEFAEWDKKCLDCSIFPICHGGCQYLASQRHGGEYGHMFCQKNILIPAYKQNLSYNIF